MEMATPHSFPPSSSISYLHQEFSIQTPTFLQQLPLVLGLLVCDLRSMAGGGGGGRELDQTPTWAVVVVCFAIVVISLGLEKVPHRIGHFFTKKKKLSMVEVLEKIKSELMILGFISLLLTFTQNYLVMICIPESVANHMLPCKLQPESEDYPTDGAGKHRRLLWEEDMMMGMGSNRRFLAGPVEDTCSHGKVPFVSVNGLHQLHIFIFFLAGYHVISSALTMTLGRLKIREWKHWENETLSLEYEFSTDPSRVHYVQDNSFVRQHKSWWNRNAFFLYVVSFLRHFFRSVRKDDYLMTRHGFISAHLAPGRRFNFQKYIKRSLEDDFKVVVGISPILWATSGIFLLLNLEGWYTMFWVSIIPLITILAVGTKLQAIITKMAMEISDKNVMIQGIPLVSLGDRHFWFKSPRFVLFLIHFTLFQNAFQLIYFIWIWHSFGFNSCFHQKIGLLIARICLGVFVQFLCSYVTLPLYALVSQLGSTLKASIFDEHTAEALKKWHQKARRNQLERTAAQTPSRSPVRSPRGSPDPPFRGYKTMGDSAAKQGEEQKSPLPLQVNSSLRHRDMEMGSISPEEQANATCLESLPKNRRQ